MTASTTIPVVLDAIEDLFAASFATAGPTGGQVQVTQGPPQSAERERITVADIGPAPEDFATMGGLVNVDEDYGVNCWIVVADPRHKTFRDCKNRAFDLLAIAQGALRVEDPFKLVSSYAYFESRFSGVVIAHGGPDKDASWAYEIHFTVGVAAII